MKVIASPSIICHHPAIENELWSVACHAKELDPDIKLMGLLVRVRGTSESYYWSGATYPQEESFFRSKQVIHPAGKINLCLGSKVDAKNKAILMAHELRHIGQFHRGRKLKGFFNLDHMLNDEIEEDCYNFERIVADKIFANRSYARS